MLNLYQARYDWSRHDLAQLYLRYQLTVTAILMAEIPLNVIYVSSTMNYRDDLNEENEV